MQKAFTGGRQYLRTGEIPFFFSGRPLSEFIVWFEARRWPGLGAICISCALLMLFFVLYGIPEGYDVAQHIKFAAAYQQAVLDGSIIPHWAASDNLGFGSPGIRFYPPLADLVLGITQIFTGDWYSTLLINSVMWIFPGCIGVYLWVNQLANKLTATAAGMLYAVMPYHLLQIYQFQLFSEYVAAAVLPFCFLFATLLVRRGSVRDIVGLAVSCSLLILTHIPSTLIGLSGLSIYLLTIVGWRNVKQTVWKLGAAASITFCLTSYYVVRLFLELDWIKHNTEEYSTGFYYFGHHFFPLIFNYGEVYQQLNLWVIDIAILMTIVVITIAFAVGFATRRSGTDSALSRIFLGITVTGVFSLLMLSSISRPIWESLSGLQKIQFPWRFMSVATLAAAVSLPLAVTMFIRQKPRSKRLVLYPVTAVILAIVLFDVTQNILQSGPLDRYQFNEKVVYKPANDFCTCWWPTWAQRETIDNVFAVSASDREVRVNEWAAVERDITVGPGEATILRIPTFYYPRWKASVNGNPVAVVLDKSGTMEIPIPADESNVRLYFEEPKTITIATVVSAAAWLSILFGLIALALPNIRKRIYELK